MTEFSYWWTTSGTPSGDQVANYTQAHLAEISKILASCSYFEGISPRTDGKLSTTATGANTVQVTTGSAIVDGRPYKNDANVNVTIPSAVGGGNTRIDRIVLRASWSAFTVRITRIAGTDAATPVPPAITQTPGTTYDIRICQVLVDTSGNCTVTHERDWAFVPVDDSSVENQAGLLRVKDLGISTAKIANDAVTDAKLRDFAANTVIGRAADTTGDPADISIGANTVLGRLGANIVATQVQTAQIADNAIDDTIVGNRVPILTRRQGGNATDWATYGSTNYTPTTVLMQAGSQIISSIPANTSSTVTITFPVAFAQDPIVLVSNATGVIGGMNWIRVSALYSNVTTTTFELRMSNFHASSAISGIANWLAIGQPT